MNHNMSGLYWNATDSWINMQNPSLVGYSVCFDKQDCDFVILNKDMSIYHVLGNDTTLNE